MLSLSSLAGFFFFVLPICFLLVCPKFHCPYSTFYLPSINQNVTLPVIDFVTCLGVTGTGMGVLSGSLLGAETQKGRKQPYGHNINVSAIPTVSSCLQSTEEKFLRSLGALVCWCSDSKQEWCDWLEKGEPVQQGHTSRILRLTEQDEWKHPYRWKLKIKKAMLCKQSLKLRTRNCLP